MTKTLGQFAEELHEAVQYGASTSDIMQMVTEWISPLQHYQDSTVGLWATDRPDLVDDPKQLMFRLVA